MQKQTLILSIYSYLSSAIFTVSVCFSNSGVTLSHGGMKRKSFKCSWIKNQLAPLWHSSSICTWWSTIVSIFSLFLASHFCLTILCEHEHWTLQYNKTGRSLECTRFIIHINVFKTNGVTFRITEFGFNQITTNIKLYISKETDTLFLDVSPLTLNVLCFCSFLLDSCQLHFG